MKKNKKKNFTETGKSSLKIKISTILYIILFVMSIGCHNFQNLGDLIMELITYNTLFMMLYVGIKTIKIKDLVELFD